jgi:beta-carotene 3-hydroxylase
VTAIVLVVVSFVAMEGVSYGAHRWVMHRFGMGWHRSHHRPPAGRFEANDLFPVVFSVVGVALFALGTVGPAIDTLFWIGIGVTAYGVAYLVVHELFIHHRLRVPLPRSATVAWLRDSHRIHHLYGGEPYGMLMPIVPRALRARAEAHPAWARTDHLDRQPALPDRPADPVAPVSIAVQRAGDAGPVEALDRNERQVDADAVGDHDRCDGGRVPQRERW